MQDVGAGISRSLEESERARVASPRRGYDSVSGGRGRASASHCCNGKKDGVSLCMQEAGGVMSPSSKENERAKVASPGIEESGGGIMTPMADEIATLGKAEGFLVLMMRVPHVALRYVFAHIYTRVHMYVCLSVHAHKHKYTHTHAHTHTHAQTHTHMHCICMCRHPSVNPQSTKDPIKLNKTVNLFVPKDFLKMEE